MREQVGETGKEASTGCVVKQVNTVDTCSLILLSKIPKSQQRTCTSKFFPTDEGAGAFALQSHWSQVEGASQAAGGVNLLAL